MLLGGCGANQPTADPPRPATSAATTPAGPGQSHTGSLTNPGPPITPANDEGAAALAAYRKFWTVASRVGHLPPDQWQASLAAVAGDPFLSELLTGLADQRDRGAVDVGTITVHPTLVLLRPSQATVLDCQDASRSGEADRVTGEIRTTGSARTPFTATLTRTADHRWRITHARYLDNPC